MNPICFYIGNRPIYWYGVMMAIAFLAAIAHWRILGRKEGRDPSFGSELAFWLMLAGIVGARIGYVLANLSEFTEKPWTILRVDQGGLIFYSGFIGAGLVAIIFARVKREKFWPFSDFVVTALPLGHAIGRTGCFLNGCCYGTPCTLPWAVSVPNPDITWMRHPTQLYSSILNVIIYLILLWFYGHRKREGRVFALYLMLYPLSRFFLEFFRGDERLHLHGFCVAQVLSLVFFIVGLALWFCLPAQVPQRTAPHRNDNRGE